MIISKRSHLIRQETEKPLMAFIDEVCSLDHSLIADRLSKNLKWDRPRGDLFNWIKLLNLFDDIFESQIGRYGLNQADPRLVQMAPEDAELVVACLKFSAMLLEHCSNKNIYSSSERIYQLILSPTVDVRLAALEVAVCLGERYIQSSQSKKYAAPKAVRNQVMQIARSYPPQVPTGFMQKLQDSPEDPNTQLRSDHYSLIDTLDAKKVYPSKWKSLNYHYYCVRHSEKVEKKESKKSSKKQHTATKQSPDKDGVAIFSLSEDVVRRQSIENIYSKASETLPADTWFGFSLAALNSKAFNSRSHEAFELRSKLLRIKCAAVAFVCSMCSHDVTSSNLFEAEPYIFNFLVDLIAPENSALVSNEIFLSSIRALECISMRRIWGNELVRNLGANVSHGMLYQLLRHMNKQVRDDSKDCFEKGFLHVFTLLGNLADSKQLIPRLAAGGLLGDLMSFLDIKTTHRWPCSAAVNTIAVFLHSSPDSIMDFISQDGFRLLISTINYEIDFALNNPEFGGGPPKDTIVYYKITLRQVNFLRKLLRLVSQLVQSDGGDRMRNLFDSPLLGGLNKILENPALFGPSVVAATLDTVLYIIHNEPTAYSILKEANVIECILKNYERLFMPSSELLMSLLEVLGAICLNKDGLQCVTQSGSIQTYFKLFFDLKLSKELVRGDMSINIGSSMDELGRHYPSLKPIILSLVKDLVQRLPDHANKFLSPIRFYTSKKLGSLFAFKGENFEMKEDGQGEIESWELTEGSNIIDNAFNFLSGLLQDSGQWGKDCIAQIPFTYWAQFLTLSNAPYDYDTSNGMTTFLGLLKYLDDEDRDYGFPNLLKLLSERLESKRVQDFIQSENNASYFEKRQAEADANSSLLEELNVINMIVLALSENYLTPNSMFNERYQSLIDILADIPHSFIGNLTRLTGRCILEEISLREVLSPDLIDKTAPLAEANDETPPLQIRGKSAENNGTSDVFTSAKFKNTLQLRFLSYRLQHNISLILTCVPRSCMQKRQDYFLESWRHNAIKFNKTLACELRELFFRGQSLAGLSKINYWLNALDIIQFVAKSKDKGREVLSTSLVLFFFHETDIMNEIVLATVDVFDGLLDLPELDAKSLNDTDSVFQTNASIMTSFVNKSLSLLGKMSETSYVPKLPFTFLFYNKNYCPNDEHITLSVISEASLLSLQLIQKIVGSDSRIYRQEDYHLFGKLALKTTVELFNLIGVIWKAPVIDDYYPLNENWGTPPYEQLVYLVNELKLEESTAAAILKQSKTLQEFVDSEADVDFMSQNEASNLRNTLRGKISSSPFKFNPIKTETGSKVSAIKHSEDSLLFSKNLLEIASYVDNLDAEVALLLMERSIELHDSILRMLRNLSDKVDEQSIKRRANFTRILKRHIYQLNSSSEDVKKHREASFKEFVELFTLDIEKNLDLGSTEYAVAGLGFMEILLSHTEPTSFGVETPFISFLSIEKEHKSRLLDAVLKLDPKENVKAAIVMSKVLYLFAKIDDFKNLVASSDLVKTIIRNASIYFKERKTDNFKNLQETLILLIRSCFEKDNFLRDVFSTEIIKVFKKQSNGQRDMKRLLNETMPLVTRDPYMYVDVASRFIRLDSFTREAHGGDIVYLMDNADSGKEDVNMVDLNESNVAPKSTGLMHYLLANLMEFSKKDWWSTPESNEKKNEKANENQFDLLLKNDNFAYICFLLQTITELLGSYKEAKLEFITFSKKEIQDEKIKPRSTSLNFLIHQLLPSQSLQEGNSIDNQRREAVSSLTKLAILCLVSTPILKEDSSPDPMKEDADLAIVRRFTMNIIFKVLKETPHSPVSTEVSYNKLNDVFDLCSCILSTKFKEMCYPLLSKTATKYDQYFVASAFIERQLPNQITSAIAEIDLNFPDVNRIVKTAMKPLTNLSKIKLNFGELFDSASGEKDDDDIVPEDVEDRDDLHDLFKNSTLGMYDVDYDSEEDEFYDDEDPLDVMMPESDASPEDLDDSEESDMESDGDGDDDEEEDDDDDQDMLDEDDVSSEELHGYDSDHVDHGIEIIDELDIHSDSDDQDEGRESDMSEFYGFNDDENEGHENDTADLEDEEMEYDDRDLDGWIDALADGDEEEHDETPHVHYHYMRGENQEEDSPIDLRSEEEDIDADEESAFESEAEDEHMLGHNHTAREFMTSIFDVLRPALRQPNVSSIFDGLVQGRLRNAFHVSGVRGADGMPGRAIELILNDKPSMTQKNSLNFMFLRSTRERWSDAEQFFFSTFSDLLAEAVRGRIYDKIYDESLEIFNKKKEEREKHRKEREERSRQRKEELKRQREEEERQREAEQESNPPTEREPVMLRIGDREVDISGTDIDPGFFEALPDDLREEVFTQHVRERRANATSTGSDVREIDPDFLNALPEPIRDEILQQESFARTFSTGAFDYLDADDDVGSDFGDEEDRDLATRAEGAPGQRNQSEETENAPKRRKTFLTPFIDKAGVASLVRLLFIPQAVNQRTHIYLTLSQLCNNKQTRSEVMSLLIAILNDALHSQRALEKLFFLICGRANNTNSQEESNRHFFPIGATPVIVGIQIIEAVFYLLEKNIHLRYYLLTEHENIFIARRNHKKNKNKQLSQEEKYPINFLLKLLENPLLNEEQFFIDLLASVLHVGTKPLLLVRDKTKQSPAIATNIIPESNLELIIRILSANECANTTFRRTISAMHNLSIMENAQKVFSLRLSQKATEFGTRIIEDLKCLTKDLDSIQNEEGENKSLSKFTAPSSDQAKLLRTLTALDYMYESKGNKKDDKGSEEVKSRTDELTELYKHLELGNLWDALSECLRVVEEHSELLNIATALLPLIEALMVVCKHSKVKELQIKDVMKYEAKKIDFTKEPIESLFFSFTDEHKKILNQMVRTNPNLMSGPFSMLVRNPKVLEFDNKKNYFDRQLHDKSSGSNKMAINIRRDQVFLDSYRALFFKSVEEFRKANLEINFKGESGIDAGGVTREWYQVLSRQMFNPDYALFSAIASDETTFHPNRTSYINPEHLSFFKFIGRIIGKAIYDGCFLDCHFSRAVYKKILERPVSMKDMETLDLEYFKSLMWMLENDITDIITEDFSVETDDYGEHKVIDLIPDGRNIPVTEDNKQEYVRLVIEYRLQTSVAEQMNNFIIGFHEIIPKDLVTIFDEQELELLISGLPDIDVQDWQNNTSYNNYSPSSEQIQWFWRAVKSFDNEERAKLLQFATGTSKVPLNGFKELRGANGGCKFSIHRDYGSTERLPSSHTCFNQIDLPVYESYETLRGSLLLAITEGHEGFGLA